MLAEAYSDYVLSKLQYFEWFKKFKSGDFDVKKEKCGRLNKKLEDSIL